jgi:hypothetical protein
MSTLRPGKEGDPLPCGTIVFRIIAPARKFRILAHTNPTRQRGL